MGNKAILMSIIPQYVAKILNGEKTIEVRKKFPKDYVGWVYIYCTKGKTPIMEYINRGAHSIIEDIKFDKNFKYYLNGKVVAKFWCDKVEKIRCYNLLDTLYSTSSMKEEELLKASCLTYLKLNDYLKVKEGNCVLGFKNGYAIHISKLEVFDKPKELKEFRHTCKAEYRGYNRWQPCSKECKKCICNQIDDEGYSQCFSRLTKAPESWYYIEDK